MSAERREELRLACGGTLHWLAWRKEERPATAAESGKRFIRAPRSLGRPRSSLT